jgi:5-methylcytosine-specific restriction enzyme B
MAQLHESILYQLILFGPPGTSKSHVARDIKAENLLIKGNEGRIFPITFHPEYCYGDFVVKRLLMTVSDDVLHYHIKSLFNSFLPALTPMLTILVQKKNPHLG